MKTWQHISGQAGVICAMAATVCLAQVWIVGLPQAPRGSDMADAGEVEETTPIDAPDHIDLPNALALKDTALWIDARSRIAFEKEHMPQAALLNEDDWDALLPNVLDRWVPGMKVVVYCGGQECHASEDVARRLREEVGLPEVYVLTGGWDAWINRDR